MQAMYDEWCQSGMSRKAFCREKGIGYATFNYWCKRLSDTGRSGFTEVALPSVQTGTIELTLPSGARLSFQELPSTSWLKELLN